MSTGRLSEAPEIKGMNEYLKALMLMSEVKNSALDFLHPKLPVQDEVIGLF
jgi:hypothetical protein